MEDKENIILWVREVEIAHKTGMILTEYQRVAVEINMITGIARGGHFPGAR